MALVLEKLDKPSRLVADVAHQRNGASKSRTDILGTRTDHLEVDLYPGKVFRVYPSLFRAFAQMEVTPKSPVERTRDFKLRPQPAETPTSAHSLSSLASGLPRFK